MNFPARMTLIVCVAILIFSCSSDNEQDEVVIFDTEIIIPETKTIEIEVLELINEYRILHGKNALEILPLAKSQAHNHTNYMIERNIISHDNFDSRRAFLEHNAGAFRVSENVGHGFFTAEAAVNTWIDSDNHRHTILSDFSNFDISAERHSNGSWYFTNIFVMK